MVKLRCYVLLTICFTFYKNSDSQKPNPFPLKLHKQPNKNDFSDAKTKEMCENVSYSEDSDTAKMCALRKDLESTENNASAKLRNILNHIGLGVDHSKGKENNKEVNKQNGFQKTSPVPYKTEIYRNQFAKLDNNLTKSLAISEDSDIEKKKFADTLSDDLEFKDLLEPDQFSTQPNKENDSSKRERQIKKEKGVETYEEEKDDPSPLEDDIPRPKMYDKKREINTRILFSVHNDSFMPAAVKDLNNILNLLRHEDKKPFNETVLPRNSRRFNVEMDFQNVTLKHVVNRVKSVLDKTEGEIPTKTHTNSKDEHVLNFINNHSQVKNISDFKYGPIQNLIMEMNLTVNDPNKSNISLQNIGFKVLHSEASLGTNQQTSRKQNIGRDFPTILNSVLNCSKKKDSMVRMNGTEIKILENTDFEKIIKISHKVLNHLIENKLHEKILEILSESSDKTATNLRFRNLIGNKEALLKLLNFTNIAGKFLERAKQNSLKGSDDFTVAFQKIILKKILSQTKGLDELFQFINEAVEFLEDHKMLPAEFVLIDESSKTKHEPKIIPNYDNTMILVSNDITKSSTSHNNEIETPTTNNIVDTGSSVYSGTIEEPLATNMIADITNNVLAKNTAEQKLTFVSNGVTQQAKTNNIIVDQSNSFATVNNIEDILTPVTNLATETYINSKINLDIFKNISQSNTNDAIPTLVSNEVNHKIPSDDTNIGNNNNPLTTKSMKDSVPKTNKFPNKIMLNVVTETSIHNMFTNISRNIIPISKLDKKMIFVSSSVTKNPLMFTEMSNTNSIISDQSTNYIIANTESTLEVEKNASLNKSNLESSLTSNDTKVKFVVKLASGTDNYNKTIDKVKVITEHINETLQGYLKNDSQIIKQNLATFNKSLQTAYKSRLTERYYKVGKLFTEQEWLNMTDHEQDFFSSPLVSMTVNFLKDAPNVLKMQAEKNITRIEAMKKILKYRKPGKHKGRKKPHKVGKYSGKPMFTDNNNKKSDKKYMQRIGTQPVIHRNDFDSIKSTNCTLLLKLKEGYKHVEVQCDMPPKEYIPQNTKIKIIGITEHIEAFEQLANVYKHFSHAFNFTFKKSISFEDQAINSVTENVDKEITFSTVYELLSELSKINSTKIHITEHIGDKKCAGKHVETVEVFHENRSSENIPESSRNIEEIMIKSKIHINWKEISKNEKLQRQNEDEKDVTELISRGDRIVALTSDNGGQTSKHSSAINNLNLEDSVTEMSIYIEKNSTTKPNRTPNQIVSENLSNEQKTEFKTTSENIFTENKISATEKYILNTDNLPKTDTEKIITLSNTEFYKPTTESIYSETVTLNQTFVESNLTMSSKPRLVFPTNQENEITSGYPLNIDPDPLLTEFVNVYSDPDISNANNSVGTTEILKRNTTLQPDTTKKNYVGNVSSGIENNNIRKLPQANLVSDSDRKSQFGDTIVQQIAKNLVITTTPNAIEGTYTTLNPTEILSVDEINKFKDLSGTFNADPSKLVTSSISNSGLRINETENSKPGLSEINNFLNQERIQLSLPAFTKMMNVINSTTDIDKSLVTSMFPISTMKDTRVTNSNDENPAVVYKGIILTDISKGSRRGDSSERDGPNKMNYVINNVLANIRSKLENITSVDSSNLAKTVENLLNNSLHEVSLSKLCDIPEKRVKSNNTQYNTNQEKNIDVVPLNNAKVLVNMVNDDDVFQKTLLTNDYNDNNKKNNDANTLNDNQVSVKMVNNNGVIQKTLPTNDYKENKQKNNDANTLNDNQVSVKMVNDNGVIQKTLLTNDYNENKQKNNDANTLNDNQVSVKMVNNNGVIQKTLPTNDYNEKKQKNNDANTLNDNQVSVKMVNDNGVFQKILSTNDYNENEQKNNDANTLNDSQVSVKMVNDNGVFQKTLPTNDYNENKQKNNDANTLNDNQVPVKMVNDGIFQKTLPTNEYKENKQKNYDANTLNDNQVSVKIVNDNGAFQKTLPTNDYNENNQKNNDTNTLNDNQVSVKMVNDNGVFQKTLPTNDYNENNQKNNDTNTLNDNQVSVKMVNDNGVSQKTLSTNDYKDSNKKNNDVNTSNENQVFVKMVDDNSGIPKTQSTNDYNENNQTNNKLNNNPFSVKPVNDDSVFQKAQVKNDFNGNNQQNNDINTSNNNFNSVNMIDDISVLKQLQPIIDYKQNKTNNATNITFYNHPFFAKNENDNKVLPKIEDYNNEMKNETKTKEYFVTNQDNTGKKDPNNSVFITVNGPSNFTEPAEPNWFYDDENTTYKINVTEMEPQKKIHRKMIQSHFIPVRTIQRARPPRTQRRFYKFSDLYNSSKPHSIHLLSTQNSPLNTSIQHIRRLLQLNGQNRIARKTIRDKLKGQTSVQIKLLFDKLRNGTTNGVKLLSNSTPRNESRRSRNINYIQMNTTQRNVSSVSSAPSKSHGRTRLLPQFKLKLKRYNPSSFFPFHKKVARKIQLQNIKGPNSLDQPRDKNEDRNNKEVEDSTYFQKPSYFIRNPKVLDWWQDDMYYKVRKPLPINSNPGMVFPSRSFTSATDVARVAAILIDGVVDYKEMLDRGELIQERAASREKGQPLCMTQFYRLLNSCRIPEAGRDRIECSARQPDQELLGDPSRDEEYVIIACNNHLYVIPVKASDRGRLSVSELRAQVLLVLADASVAPRAPHVTLLTAGDRDTWATAREVLAEDEGNRRNMDLISRALCLVCLDSEASVGAEPLLQMMHGGGSANSTPNRWFDKTLQFIISKNGYFGLCYEHSPAEGIAVIRLAEELVAKVESPAHEGGAPPALLPPPERLQWFVEPKVERAIVQAAREIDRLINDLDLKVYHYGGYGKDFMKSCKVSPDVYIQLALQYAYYKMYGCLVSTYESASLRRFRRGRVDNIRSAHSAARAWAAAMCAQDDSPTPPASPAATGDDDLLINSKKVTFNLYNEQKKVTLFSEAARKQTEVMVANILGAGIDNHLLGLREAARELDTKLPEFFTDPTFNTLMEFKLSTSQVATGVNGTYMGYGPVVPDGYGASYNPKKDSVIFCISSFTSSDVTNTEAFKQSLEEALDAMKLMFERGKTVDKSTDK